MTDRLERALARGLLVLDAAMGTRLIDAGLDLASDDPCLWNLTHPDSVAAIHRRDADAGAIGLLTNTFGANRVWLSRFGRDRDVRAINRAGCELVRAAAGDGEFVIGSIGPTAAAEPGSYREQADVLVDAGADAILFETHRAEQAELALRQFPRPLAVPMIASLMDWSSGDRLEEQARRLINLGAWGLGVNCVPELPDALGVVEALRHVTRAALFLKPGTSRPANDPGTVEMFARAVPRAAALGPIMFGGCCGTTEAHVAAIRASCYHVAASIRDAGSATDEERRP